MGIRSQQHVPHLVREHVPQELRRAQFSLHSDILYSVDENPCITPEPSLSIFGCETKYVSLQMRGLRCGEWKYIHGQIHETWPASTRHVPGPRAAIETQNPNRIRPSLVQNFVRGRFGFEQRSEE